jgi:hypothetical protein
MLRKFAEGLLFGAGFTISFVILVALGGSVLFGSMVPTSRWSASSGPVTTTQQIDEDEKKSSPFYELPIEQQIEEASIIALARYEPAEDGRMRAVLKEILKQKDGVTFYYQLGDEYTPSSYYPKSGTSYGDGIVIFFEGSPAMMRRAISYSGNRITGLGDMPIELFRDKCEKEAA